VQRADLQSRIVMLAQRRQLSIGRDPVSVTASCGLARNHIHVLGLCETYEVLSRNGDLEQVEC